MNYWLVRIWGWTNGGLNEAVEWGDGQEGKDVFSSSASHCKLRELNPQH